MKINKKKDRLALSYFILPTIFIAFFFNFYYGFLGINLIDSFQTFDSGYRVLQGDIPYKDYIVRDGAVIDIMQAAFFKLFGVNWSAFVVHSSVINSMYAISILFFAKDYGVNNKECFLYAITASLLLYPPAGTPQIDHHAFALSFICLSFFLYIQKNKKFYFLIIIPTLFGLILFIKPVPTIYFILIVLFFTLYHFRANKKIFYYLVIGTIIYFLLFFIILKIFDIKLLSIYNQIFTLTLGTGLQRFTLSNLQSLILSTLKIKYILLLTIPFFVSILHFKKKIKIIKQDIILTIFLFIAVILHESYTWNQAVTVAILPVLALLIRKIIKIKDLENNKLLKIIFYLLISIVSIRLIKIEFLYGLIPLGIFLLFKFIIKKISVSQLILTFTLILTFFYYNKLIISRYWLDIYNPDWSKSYNAETIDVKLKNLVWLSNNQDSKKEINTIKNNLEFLNSIDENFIIITHLQIYNILLEKKNFSPVKYWWKDNTYPSKNSYFKKDFDLFFKKKINSNNIKRLIILPDVLSIHTGSFDIKEFNWLENCSKKQLGTSNTRRTVYEIISVC